MTLAEEVLRQGHALVLFPEGTRKEGPDVAAAARRRDVHRGANRGDVVPVGIGGSDRAMPMGAKLPRFAKIRIVVGAPIAPPSFRRSRRAVAASPPRARNYARRSRRSTTRAWVRAD